MAKITNTTIKLWQHFLSQDGGAQPDWKQVSKLLLDEVVELRKKKAKRPKQKIS